MPKLTQINGYIIYFWANENDEPCHVHISKKRAVKNATKIWIEPQLKIAHNNSKIKQSDLNEILKWLANNRQFVLDAWNNFFK